MSTPWSRRSAPRSTAPAPRWRPSRCSPGPGTPRFRRAPRSSCARRARRASRARSCCPRRRCAPRAPRRTSGWAGPGTGSSRCPRRTSRACRWSRARTRPGEASRSRRRTSRSPRPASPGSSPGRRAPSAGTSRSSPRRLHRLLAAAEAGSDGGAAGLDALRALDAVLLGGAAAPPALLRRARAAGARVVTTYGMTETSGGCVYDGVPLAGARVRLARPTPADGQGRATGVVELSGPFLADGYLGDPAATAYAFRTDDDGTRWFRTSDLGRLDGAPDGPSLTVLGRADDVVVTGGVNVAPAAVEALVAEVDGVGEACVVGVPHPEWGQEVVAVVTTAWPSPAAPGSAPGTGTGPGAEGSVAVADAPAALVATVRDHVADRLERAAAPRRVLVVVDLPRRGPGKVDRAAVARLAVGHLQARPG
ncbi:AMP-binding enzyme [Cellulosimicrobium sp. E-16]|uniref:AMP-binding enzyme n=1 Tax=Cellulosimicrobium sp. E-16 TaxID=3404049 RepID=UPI003CF0F1D1